jgi:hypothetical protein
MILMPLGTGIIGGARLASVAFASLGMSTSNSSSYNYGSKNIGTANAKRTLIAWLTWNPLTSANFSNISVDGTPMTFRFGNTASATGATTQILTLPWPTGTTATITAAATASMSSCYWMLWAAYNLQSEVPTATHSALGFGANPATDNINVSAGGIIIAGSAAPASSSSGFTWTGVTEDADQLGGISNTVRMSGGSAAYKNAQTPLVVSSNANSANHINTMASFR